MVNMGRLSTAASRKMPGFHRGRRWEKLADKEFSLLYSN
jgi:hypothetical protein